jgi:hypothetical protein
LASIIFCSFELTTIIDIEFSDGVVAFGTVVGVVVVVVGEVVVAVGVVTGFVEVGVVVVVGVVVEGGG